MGGSRKQSAGDPRVRDECTRHLFQSFSSCSLNRRPLGRFREASRRGTGPQQLGLGFSDDRAPDRRATEEADECAPPHFALHPRRPSYFTIDFRCGVNRPCMGRFLSRPAPGGLISLLHAQFSCSTWKARFLVQTRAIERPARARAVNDGRVMRTLARACPWRLRARRQTWVLRRDHD